MECDECETEKAREFVLMPYGKILCSKCAKKSSAYCRKHKKPHLGFYDGTTACTDCIERLVKKNRKEAKTFWKIFEDNMPEDEMERINEWAEEISFLPIARSKEISLLRAIATRALRANQSIEDIMKEAVESKSADLILPWGF